MIFDALHKLRFFVTVNWIMEAEAQCLQMEKELAEKREILNANRHQKYVVSEGTKEQSMKLSNLGISNNLTFGQP